MDGMLYESWGCTCVCVCGGGGRGGGGIHCTGCFSFSPITMPYGEIFYLYSVESKIYQLSAYNSCTITIRGHLI